MADGGYTSFANIWEQAGRQPSVTAQATHVAREFGAALLLGCVPYAVGVTAMTYHWALKVARARRRRLGDRPCIIH
jgi:hypothetical protein